MPKRWLILTGVIVIIIAAGIGYSLINSQAGKELVVETAPPVPQSPRELTPVRESFPPSLEQKLESLKKAVQTAATAGEASEITITVTEEEANSQIAPRLVEMEMPEDIPLELESVQFDFQEDKVVATITGTGYGLTGTAYVTARVNVIEGRPEVEITEIKYGWLPLPGFIKSEINQMIARKSQELETGAMNSAAIEDIDWSVTEISIQDEAITVSLIIQPKPTAE